MTTLPPPPSAVAEYFRLRRSTLKQLTPEDLSFNEALWRRLPDTAAPNGPPLAAGVSEMAYMASDDVEAASEETAVPAPRCGGCGREYRPTRPWAKFCSPACEQRARRARRRAGTIGVNAGPHENLRAERAGGAKRPSLSE
jgi:hypothetical protein